MIADLALKSRNLDLRNVHKSRESKDKNISVSINANLKFDTTETIFGLDLEDSGRMVTIIPLIKCHLDWLSNFENHPWTLFLISNT